MKHAAMMPSIPARGNVVHLSNGYTSGSNTESAAPEMVLENLIHLQAQLDRLVAAIEPVTPQRSSQSYIEGKPSEGMIRSILKSRLERNSYFQSNIFADPAWDILLDLYAAELAQIRVSVSSLCIASNVPHTTALRWINSLESENLIKRSPDPLDGRRFFMSLTQSAIRSFEEYFSGSARMAVI